jgi:eukaryotic-like serine/threonine-protein kinase
VIKPQDAGDGTADTLQVRTGIGDASDGEDLPAGTVVGEYRLVGLIGRGGMGSVYQAEQPEIGAQVAVKVVAARHSRDADLVRRFVDEARAVNKIRHPNIVDIFAFGRLPDGRQYFIMEYLEGETLTARLARGPVPAPEARRLLRQICAGLHAAHAERIVHRDLKPDNLWIAKPKHGEPFAKILDFGIAKLLESQDAATITASGMTMGTAHFMSPEQCRGDAVDHRTDIYALGVILYEMFAGRRPFDGTSFLAVVSQQMTATPAPPSSHRPVPPALEDLIMDCLEKDPALRPQSIRELSALLDAALGDAAVDETRPPASARASARRTTAAAATTAVAPPTVPITTWMRRWRPLLVTLSLAVAVAGLAAGWRAFRPAQGRVMMAVLPFQNFAGDAQQEYFSDGLTEGMISQLSRLQPAHLAVIARTSVNQYKRSSKSVKEIGRELDVAYVLECSVERTGDRVAIAVHLIQVGDQTQIWAERYDRDVKDLAALHDEIAREVADRLQLPRDGRLAGGRTFRPIKPAAYDAYLRGRFFFDKKTPEANRQALAYFEQAIAIDPAYAAAHSGVADVYATMPMNSRGSELQVGPKAKAAALRALELDERLADAHSALAYILFNYEWDWPGAEKHYRRALELDPNNVEAHRRYGMDYLATSGQFDQAIAELERARQLAPFSLPVNLFLANTYYMARRHDEAVAQLRRTIELDPRFWAAHLVLGTAYATKGLYADALTELQKMEDAVPGVALPQIAYVHARAGRTKAARAILERLESDPGAAGIAALIARVYVGLGQPDEAFAWLEKAYQERSFWLAFLRVEPQWDPIRQDPRFADLVRRVGIPALP